jgi:hypothetical protein
MAADLEDLRARLTTIAEELADVALVQLRATVEDGDADAARAEKKITRARRSVEKAAMLLADVDGAGADDDWGDVD